MTTAILSQLFVYPVKSLAGFAVSQWQVAKTGLLYDRKWMLIDAQQQFLSQRKLPQMALIKTAIDDKHLILSALNMPEIRLPLDNNSDETISCQVWHDNCLAKTVSQEADSWLSEFLKIDCRLVYQPEDSIRRVDQNYAQPTDQTGFSDGFPFLLVSQASLDALNQTANLNLSINRFRPNLVIGGCAAYAEDYWREISIGGIGFRLPKACSRCAVPGINPETAQHEKEPLAALSSLRKWQQKTYFGQNALHNNGGVLTVGDKVTVHAEGVAQPPLAGG
jgi:uncharacterized protein